MLLSLLGASIYWKEFLKNVNFYLFYGWYCKPKGFLLRIFIFLRSEW